MSVFVEWYQVFALILRESNKAGYSPPIHFYPNSPYGLALLVGSANTAV